MKKIFTLFLLILLAFAVACGGDPAEIVSEAATRGGDVAATAAAVATDVADGPDSEGETEAVAPTEEPTEEPTEVPTEAPTEVPTEEPTPEPTPTEEPTPTVEPTEVPEGVSPDWVELQEDTLQDPVFLTGMLLDDSTVTESQGQATLATGHNFAYRNFPYYRDHPLLGITSGMNGWALVVSNGTIEDMIFAPTAKESQTAAGSAALQNLISLTANTILVIRDIGETNSPVKQGDIVEISYGSAGNMSLPYILTIYRPETNEILAEFELNSQ
jgi:hypothetical protein